MRAGISGVDIYCENCDVAPTVEDGFDPDAVTTFGSPSLGVMPYSIDSESAVRLWALSAELTGTPLPS